MLIDTGHQGPNDEKRVTAGGKIVRMDRDKVADSYLQGKIVAIKAGTAALIDQIEEYKWESNHKLGKDQSWRDESQRLYSLAATHYEMACMLAVKAVTT